MQIVNGEEANATLLEALAPGRMERNTSCIYVTWPIYTVLTHGEPKLSVVFENVDHVCWEPYGQIAPRFGW